MRFFNKKLKKLLKISVILILSINFVLNFSGCGFLYAVCHDIYLYSTEEEYQYEKIRDIEKYKNYKRYDAHLQCTNVYGISKSFTREDFEGSHKYRKIHSVSDEQFICLSQYYFPYEAIETHIVLQNPDNYVDVFNEWTVERIDFIDKKGNVIGTLTDQSVIENFKEFINSEKTSQELNEPWSYHDVKNYRVRIYYEESENMQWETAIQHYTSYLYGDYFYVQQINLETGDDSYASISNYPEIYNWLSDCFANIDSQ